MKESILNVQLVNEPTACNSYCKETTQSSMFGSGRESVLVINNLNLGITFGNHAGFVTFKRSIRLVLEFKNPFGPDRFMACQKRNQIPGIYFL